MVARRRKVSSPSPGSARGRTKKKKVEQQVEKWDQQKVLHELSKFTEAAKRVKRGDDWSNIFTGLGMPGKDWRQSTQLDTDDILTRQQLDDIYTQDNLAARIIDSLPEHACRRWIKIVSSDEDTEDFQKEVNEHFKRLRLKQRILQWMKLGRKDGGAILLIGADDGQLLNLPLDPQRTKEVRHIHALERWAVIPDVIDLDPLSPNFGEPLYYLLLPRAIQSSTFVAPDPKILREQNTLDGLRIHYSRVFAHEGIQISERRKIAQRGWGYSVMQRCWWSIENYRVLWGHISTVFKHVIQTFIKFAGYQDLIGSDFANAINARLAQIQLARSTLNLVPLDKEDEVVEQTLQGISGAMEVFKYAQEELAQASDMPLTMLFGHKPLGFSTEDDAGMRNWYDRVKGVQEDLLLEPITRMIDLCINAYGIKAPEQWEVEFLPLEEPSDLETADRRNKDAQTSQIYINTGVLDPEEVRETMRSDPKNAYVMDDGPAEGDTVANPPPDPMKLTGVGTTGGPPPKPSPGDPSRVERVRRGMKGEQVTP